MSDLGRLHFAIRPFCVAHPAARMPPAKKPPPEFDDEALREHQVIKNWRDKGYKDMDLLAMSDKFLQACKRLTLHRSNPVQMG